MALLLLGQNLLGTVRAVAESRERLQFDMLVQNLRVAERDRGAPFHVVGFAHEKVSIREKPYYLLLSPEELSQDKRELLMREARDRKIDLILTSPEIASELVRALAVTSFVRLAPERQRWQWLTLLALTPEPPTSDFVPVSQWLDFGSWNVNVVSGFRNPDRMGEASIRWTIGPTARFLFRGHEYFEEYGARLTINCVAHKPGQYIRARASLNGHLLEEHRARSGRALMLNYSIPPNVIHPGDNMVRIDLQDDSGNPVGPRERVFVIDWAKVELPSS